nr:MAG: RNA-dependent RNA polymerase [Moss associated botourmia-like virus 98]
MALNASLKSKLTPPHRKFHMMTQDIDFRDNFKDFENFVLAEAVCKSTSFGGVTFLSRFVQFVQGVRASYDVDLLVPELNYSCRFSVADSLKRFCGSLIEGDVSHPWLVPMRGLSRNDRMTISFSLFLFRKVIPSRPVDVEAYRRKVVTPSGSADPRFLGHIRKSLLGMFPVGWDYRYVDKAISYVPNVSSCVENGRSGGGARGYYASRWDSHCSFVTRVLTGEGISGTPFARVVEVHDGNKGRIVTVPTVGMTSLGPLHSVLYDHISQFDWCLRGEAKASRFSGFERKNGEVYVSGDYESATDALNQNVSRFILTTILGRCRSVPSGVSAYAVESLSMLLSFAGDDERVRQLGGQMMGNLLSFPLLCLFNYLCFTYHVGSGCPVRINGDDIVFRAPREVADKWMDGVKECGLVLSRGKTLVDPTYFTLNSALFRGKGSKVVDHPFVRPKCLFPSGSSAECVASMSGRASRFGSHLFGAVRDVWCRVFLSSWRDVWKLSRRSLSRGLGIRFPKSSLVGSYRSRELVLLGLPKELPLPPPPSELLWDRPQGWSYCKRPDTAETRSTRREFFSLCAELSWSVPPRKVRHAENEYLRLLRCGTSPLPPPPLSLSRLRTMTGLSRREAISFSLPRWTRKEREACRLGRSPLRGGGVDCWVAPSSELVLWTSDQELPVVGVCVPPPAFL